MASARRPISNLGDVQLALNDIFTQLENLTTQPQNFNKRMLTGIPDPKNPLDAVNLETLQSYVSAQVAMLQKQIPNKVPQQPLNAPNELFSRNLVPKTTGMFNIGSSALQWLGAFFSGVVQLSILTALKPLKLDGSSNIIASDIVLTSDVSGILPRANGGLNNSAISSYAGTCSGTFTGTVTGTTCSGTFTGTTATDI